MRQRGPDEEMVVYVTANGKRIKQLVFIEREGDDLMIARVKGNLPDIMQQATEEGFGSLI